MLILGWVMLDSPCGVRVGSQSGLKIVKSFFKIKANGLNGRQAKQGKALNASYYKLCKTKD